MDPEKTGCPNPDCPLHGQIGQGNISLHSKKEKRFLCRNCNKTFAATRGTPFYRRRYDEETITCVITLLAYGCPVQAACEAFSLDERTVSAWREAAAAHCEGVHQALVENTKMIHSPGSANTARSSSAKWSSTNMRIGSATSGGPKEFSSGSPKNSGSTLPDEPI